MLRRAAWGVDLTGGAVQAVHLEKRGARYRVLDVVEQPYSTPGDASETLLSHLPAGCDRALHELLNRRASTLVDPVFVALPTFGARHGFVELQLSDPAKAEALLDFELHQALGGDLSQWAVRVGSLRRSAAGLGAPFFAQRRDLLASFLNDVRRVGLPVDGLVPGPVALARYARSEWPDAGLQLVLEVKRTRTDYVYVTPERTRFRSSPLGCGALKEPEFLPRNAQKDFDDLAGRIAREQIATRKALLGVKDGTALSRVYLLGDGARHPELRAALAELLHTEVVVPHLGRSIEVAHARSPEQAARALQLGTPLGLALAALDPEHAGTWNEEASLVKPPADRRALRSLPALTTALLIVAFGLLALRWIVGGDVERDERELARMKALVPWGAVDDWEEARRAATADAQRVAELAGKAAALRNQLSFPSRLLDSLRPPDVGARLTSLELRPGDGQDEAELEFEIDRASSGSLERLCAHLEATAGLSVVASEGRATDGGGLVAKLKVAVHRVGGAP
jgi:hypothetical protein